MKAFVFGLSLFMPLACIAADPMTSCPAGYIEIQEDAIVLSDSESCPAGYVSAGPADSCLVASPSGNCMMYAPAGVSFTDDGGTYQWTTMCPLS